MWQGYDRPKTLRNAKAVLCPRHNFLSVDSQSLDSPLLWKLDFPCVSRPNAKPFQIFVPHFQYICTELSSPHCLSTHSSFDSLIIFFHGSLQSVSCIETISHPFCSQIPSSCEIPPRDQVPHTYNRPDTSHPTQISPTVRSV
jgi:hypothetical protein